MSTPEKGYTVKTQVHINDLDRATGTVTPGWEVTVMDTQTGVVVPVFIPDTVYGAEQAEQLIAHALATVRAVHALGR